MFRLDNQFYIIRQYGIFMGENYCSKCDRFVSSRIFNSTSQMCDIHHSQKVLIEAKTGKSRVREAQKKAIAEARKKGRVSTSTAVAYKGVSCGEILARKVRVELIVSKCGICGQSESYFPVE